MLASKFDAAPNRPQVGAVAARGLEGTGGTCARKARRCTLVRKAILALLRRGDGRVQARSP